LINLHEPPSVAVEIDNIAMSMSDISSELKIVIVGDGAVGKTCFCTVFAKKEFPSDYIPTVFETHPIKMKLYDKEYTITIWDTAGQEEFDHIRR